MKTTAPRPDEVMPWMENIPGEVTWVIGLAVAGAIIYMVGTGIRGLTRR